MSRLSKPLKNGLFFALALALPVVTFAQEQVEDEPDTTATSPEAVEQLRTSLADEARQRALLRYQSAKEGIHQLKFRGCGARPQDAEHYLVALVHGKEEYRLTRKIVCDTDSNVRFIIADGSMLDAGAMSANPFSLETLLRHTAAYIKKKKGTAEPNISLYARGRLASMLARFLWIRHDLPAIDADISQPPPRVTVAGYFIADPTQVPLPTYHLRWPLGTGSPPIGKVMPPEQYLSVIQAPVTILYHPELSSSLSLQMWELGSTPHQRFTNIGNMFESARSELESDRIGWQFQPTPAPLHDTAEYLTKQFPVAPKETKDSEG